MGLCIRVGGLSISTSDLCEKPRSVRETERDDHTERWERDIPEALANLQFARHLHRGAIPTRELLAVLEATSTDRIPPVAKRHFLLRLKLVACVMIDGLGHWDLTITGRYELEESGAQPSFDEPEMRALFRRCHH